MNLLLLKTGAIAVVFNFFNFINSQFWRISICQN